MKNEDIWPCGGGSQVAAWLEPCGTRVRTHTHTHTHTCTAVPWHKPSFHCQAQSTVILSLLFQCRLPPTCHPPHLVQGPWSHTLPPCEIRWLRERAKGGSKGACGGLRPRPRRPGGLGPVSSLLSPPPLPQPQGPRNLHGRKKMNSHLGVPVHILCLT